LLPGGIGRTASGGGHPKTGGDGREGRCLGGGIWGTGIGLMGRWMLGKGHAPR